MPELPEVETVVRRVRALLVGHTFGSQPFLAWPRVVHTPDLKEFRSLLPGHRVQAVDRRAKYILLSLDRGQRDPRSGRPDEGTAWTLVFHLGMTGHLQVVPASAPPDPFSHTVLPLEDGIELRFRDPRKFGKLWLVPDATLVVGGLGPDPLDPSFTADMLAGLLQGRRTLKALLMDQAVIGGIGNVYADEALFAAGLHPLRPAGELTREEVGRLRAAIVSVLETAIRHETDGYLGPNERLMALTYSRTEGRPCRRCGGPIHRIQVHARSTYFCPACQPR